MSEEKKDAFEVRWSIENIESWFQTRNDIIYSPQIIVESFMNTRWKLSLSTSWRFGENYLTLALQRDVEDNGPEFLALEYQLLILAGDDLFTKSKTFKVKFAPETIGNGLSVKLDDIKESGKFFIENILTVRCRFWYSWSAVLNTRHCFILSVIGEKSLTLDGTIEDFKKLECNSFVALNFTSPSSDISLISFEVYRLSYDSVHFERKKVDCKSFRSYSSVLNVVNNMGQNQHIDNLKTLLTSYRRCTFHSQFSFLSNYCLPNGALKFQLKITYHPGVETECIDYYVNKYKEEDDKSLDQKNVEKSNSKKLRRPENANEKCSIEKKKSGEDEPADKTLFPATTLKEDLTTLYRDRLFCDTNLRNNTETFPAHKSVLSARSPVFKKMFTTEMADAGGCINIPDISSDTLRHLLQFLYMDCTEDLDMKNAQDLYIVSNTYDIASLKNRCCSFIKDNLFPSNVCEVLILADMYQDKNLKSAAHEFIFMYDKEVFSTEEWKLFMKQFSDLATQVMYLKCMKQ